MQTAAHPRGILLERFITAAYSGKADKMLILASASPRRAEILSMLGYEFQIIPASCDENTDGLSAKDAVGELARRKAMAVAKAHPQCTVLGSDTLVTLEGKVLGKPKSTAEAAEMLATLSGKTHSVFTGISVVQGDKCITKTVEAKVTFRELTPQEIADYIATNEPMDKAGAYGIQGKGAVLVEEIQGDFFNVMGLPAAQVYLLLKQFGFNGQ